MAIQFPTSPTDDQQYVYGGTTYVWKATPGVWKQKTGAMDPDLVAIADANNSSVLVTTSAAFTAADKNKLDSCWRPHAVRSDANRTGTG